MAKLDFLSQDDQIKAFTGNFQSVQSSNPPGPLAACHVLPPPVRFLQGAMLSPANVKEISVADASSLCPRAIRPQGPAGRANTSRWK